MNHIPLNLRAVVIATAAFIVNGSCCVAGTAAAYRSALDCEEDGVLCRELRPWKVKDKQHVLVMHVRSLVHYAEPACLAGDRCGTWDADAPWLHVALTGGGEGWLPQFRQRSGRCLRHSATQGRVALLVAVFEDNLQPQEWERRCVDQFSANYLRLCQLQHTEEYCFEIIEGVKLFEEGGAR